ncbi:MAG: D-alanyl-D-alanine carboxypeptidase/D-alanyl-D-alanine-endopeptidase [Deltaproteobacteria bacterium]|nr:D-alanyl-D-alanine carboxypeptidase/D-alanyl-D-alanine-endopeptidase [Deltaproteobacteria bacterium]
MKKIKQISAHSIILFLISTIISLSVQADGANGFESLKKSLDAISSKAPGNSIAGVAVMDINSGEVIYSKNGEKLFNPASNTKIVTAAAALAILGPEYRFTTSIYGKKDGRTINGSLYIKGNGDPSLMSEDLWEMIKELHAKGIRRIRDGIIVDDTYFDGENLPFAFDQQPGEDNKFRTPVGAVSLNYNSLTIQIEPGPAAMSKAKVTFNPPEYAVLVNDTLTSASGAYTPGISSLPFEDRTKVRVWGQIPIGSGSAKYYRRIDNPSLFTGYALKGILTDSGISVGGDVTTGKIPSGTPLLATNISLPLSSILWETGKMSNNFVTEMVLKNIGAANLSSPATWDDATGEVKKLLATWGIKADSYTYKNGSGLFDANMFTPLQFCTILRSAYLDPGVRPEFLSQLATGGVDGTIASRFKGPESKRRVRAKTGTLDDVSALSGYVFDSKGEHPIAFSILVNKASGYVSGARKYQEDIATVIARFLNK